MKNATHVGVRVGDDVLAALAKATAGRKGYEPLFLRPRWRQVPAITWEKIDRWPWTSSSERICPGDRGEGRVAVGTVPYALRHSSIVRGLRAGLPFAGSPHCMTQAPR